MFMAAMTRIKTYARTFFRELTTIQTTLNLPSELLPICIHRVPVNVTASPSSAALGAMYAPLALKFVYDM